LWGKGRPAHKADNLTAICEPIARENVGTSTSHNPVGRHGLLQGYLYLFFFMFYADSHMALRLPPNLFVVAAPATFDTLLLNK
jgi:hypothetical protein